MKIKKIRRKLVQINFEKQIVHFDPLYVINCLKEP